MPCRKPPRSCLARFAGWLRACGWWGSPWKRDRKRGRDPASGFASAAQSTKASTRSRRSEGAGHHAKDTCAGFADACDASDARPRTPRCVGCVACVAVSGQCSGGGCGRSFCPGLGDDAVTVPRGKHGRGRWRSKSQSKALLRWICAEWKRAVALRAGHRRRPR